MKKQYNIPTTTSVSFYAGSICQTSAGGGDAGMSVTGNSGLDIGGTLTPGSGFEPL